MASTGWVDERPKLPLETFWWFYSPERCHDGRNVRLVKAIMRGPWHWEYYSLEEGQFLPAAPYKTEKWKLVTRPRKPKGG